MWGLGARQAKHGIALKIKLKSNKFKYCDIAVPHFGLACIVYYEAC